MSHRQKGLINISVLLYFVAGMAFSQWGMPLLDSIISIILQKCEVIKGKMAVQVAKYALETDNRNNDKSSAIGFLISDTEQDDYDNDEDF